MEPQIFDPQEVLEVAEALSKEGGEARRRSAISRAYYGAFLMARDAAGIQDDTSGVHAATWRHYVDRGETQLARDLRKLRKARNLADYKTDRRVPPQICDEALEACQRVRSSLRRLTPGQIRAHGQQSPHPRSR